VTRSHLLAAAGYDALMGKKNSKVNTSQRTISRPPGRFALLPVRDEVITSARVKRLLETSEPTSLQAQDHVSETLQFLHEDRSTLNANLSDVIGDGRD
jgi:hypothetical protein